MSKIAWVRLPEGLAAVVAACLLASCLVPRVASADEGRAMMPEGRLVPIPDSVLHLVCIGAGAPSVVLEAGLGANHLDWSLVQPLLAGRFRTCSYDRAGAGWSARTTRSRDLAGINEDLHALVAAAPIARPFLLVGHSFGGLLSLGYVRRYPADVAGLLLLDSMHPAQFERFAAAGVVLEISPQMVLGRTPASAAAYKQPAELQAIAVSLAERDTARVFTVREMRLLDEDTAALRTSHLPRLPALLLVHGNGEWNAAYPDGRMEAVWRDLQADLAADLGAPAPRVIASSGHQIALDAPEAVAAAIRELADALPSQPPPAPAQ